MVDANVRLAGRVLAGALAIVSVAAVIPGLLTPKSITPVRGKFVPVRADTTTPTVLHAVEGYEGTPSPLPASRVTAASREQSLDAAPAATSAALPDSVGPDFR